MAAGYYLRMGGGHALTFGAGLALAYIAYKTYSCGKHIYNVMYEDEIEQKLQDGIDIISLGELTRSENVSLKRSAAQILLDRTMHSKNIRFVVSSACRGNSMELRCKAATTLGLLAKSDENKEKLIRYGALFVLVECCERDASFRLRKLAIIPLFDLIYGNSQAKKMVVKSGIIKVLIEILRERKSRDLSYWALVVVHQLSLNEDLREELVCMSALPVLTRMTRASQGNDHTQKLCLHTLVLLTSTDNELSYSSLNEIVECGIIKPAVVSLKSDDAELVYWALGLIHELALKDVGKDELRECPGILKAIYGVLNSSEANVQKIVLRTLGFLAIKNDVFKYRVLNSGILSRLVVCLSSGDPDVSHWAIVLIHDLAMYGEVASEKLLKTEGIIAALVQLTHKGDSFISRLVAETLGFICAYEQYHPKLVDSGALDAIMLFANADDDELHFWAAALLLNLTVTSDSVKKSIIDSGGVDALIDLVLTSRKEQVPSMAAKTLVMLSLVCHEINGRVCTDVIFPLTQEIVSIPTAANINKLEELTLLRIFARSDVYKMYIVDSRNLLPILRDMVWQLAHRKPSIARMDGNFMFAHGIAALKTLSVLSSNAYCTRRVIEEGALAAVSALLFAVEERTSIKMYSDSSSDSDVSDTEVALMRGLTKRGGHGGKRRRGSELLTYDPSARTYKYSEGAEEEVLFNSQVVEIQDLKRSVDDEDNFRSSHASITSLYSSSSSIAHTKDPDFDFYSNIEDEDRGKKVPVGENEKDDDVVGAIEGEEHLFAKGDNSSETLSRETEQKDGVRSELSNGNSDLVPQVSDVEKAGTVNSDERHRRSESSVHRRRPLTRRASDFDVEEEQDLLMNGRTSSSKENEEEEAMNDGFAESLSDLKHIAAMTIANSCSIFKTLNVPKSASANNGAYPLSKEEFLFYYHKAFEQACGYGFWSCMFGQLSPGTSFYFHNTLTLLAEISAVAFCIDSKVIVVDPESRFSDVNEVRYETPDLSEIVQIAVGNKTPNAIVSSDHLGMRNDCWTFESARCTAYVGELEPKGKEKQTEKTEGVVEAGETGDGPLPSYSEHDLELRGGKWYYEVLIYTDGIIQIGWAAHNSEFEPGKGIGVGDDVLSYAYDGARCRAWHGPVYSSGQSTYGEEWKKGDIVSCLFDVTKGEISFWLNGVDLGVAFTNVDNTKRWHPAVSVANQQQCRFRFSKEMFEYEPPVDCKPLSRAPKNESLQYFFNLSVPEMCNPVIVNEKREEMSSMEVRHDYVDLSLWKELYPILYYEVVVDKVFEKGLQMGFQVSKNIVYGIEVLKSGVVSYFCLLKQDEVPGEKLRDIHKYYIPLSPRDVWVNDIDKISFGCGIDVGSGRVFFTLKGWLLEPPEMFNISPLFPETPPMVQEIGHIANFRRQAMAMSLNIKPYIRCCSVIANYGQHPFLFRKANKTSSRMESLEWTHLRGQVLSDIYFQRT
eukprot:Nk52_evm68s224 gene=Nk52_evmTU68s224